jgi:hypothetical protein
MSYDPSTTSILLFDPYNDFLSEGGKLWPREGGSRTGQPARPFAGDREG